MIDIWIKNIEKDGEIIISTSMDEIKPYIYIRPKNNEWIKVSLPENSTLTNEQIEYIDKSHTRGY